MKIDLIKEREKEITQMLVLINPHKIESPTIENYDVLGEWINMYLIGVDKINKNKMKIFLSKSINLNQDDESIGLIIDKCTELLSSWRKQQNCSYSKDVLNRLKTQYRQRKRYDFKKGVIVGQLIMLSVYIIFQYHFFD